MAAGVELVGRHPYTFGIEEILQTVGSLFNEGYAVLNLHCIPLYLLLCASLRRTCKQHLRFLIFLYLAEVVLVALGIQDLGGDVGGERNQGLIILSEKSLRILVIRNQKIADSAILGHYLLLLLLQVVILISWFPLSSAHEGPAGGLRLLLIFVDFVEKGPSQITSSLSIYG